MAYNGRYLGTVGGHFESGIFAGATNTGIFAGASGGIFRGLGADVKRDAIRAGVRRERATDAAKRAAQLKQQLAAEAGALLGMSGAELMRLTQVDEDIAAWFDAFCRAKSAGTPPPTPPSSVPAPPPPPDRAGGMSTMAKVGIGLAVAGALGGAFVWKRKKRAA